MRVRKWPSIYLIGGLGSGFVLELVFGLRSGSAFLLGGLGSGFVLGLALGLAFRGAFLLRVFESGVRVSAGSALGLGSMFA